MKITDFVKKDVENLAKFKKFRAGILYYEVKELNGGRVFEFQVPADDLMGATVERNIRAVTLMRYIRIAIENNSLFHVHTVPEPWVCDVCEAPQTHFHAIIIDGKNHCNQCSGKAMFSV